MTGVLALQAVKAGAQGCKGTSVTQTVKQPFQLSLQCSDGSLGTSPTRHGDTSTSIRTRDSGWTIKMERQGGMQPGERGSGPGAAVLSMELHVPALLLGRRKI